MHFLWIATKAPWPPIDGGRLLLSNSLRALADAGHRVTLVAPCADSSRAEATGALRELCHPELVAARRPPRALTALWALARREPWTAVRHRSSAVRSKVRELVQREPFDLAVAEQVQAVAALPASSRLPSVWRAQNVESDLWAATAEETPPPLRYWLRLEARRLAALEGRAVREAAATLALTREDRDRLETLSGRSVLHVPAPFEGCLASGSVPLSGEPPIVLFGSAGWRPNRSGADRFIDRTWPLIRAEVPGARLHVFGAESLPEKGIEGHPSPDDSRQAFPRGSILVVPLSVASGVRMKILEAWARGVAVVATPAAARGLDVVDGRELLIARSEPELAAAVARLAVDPELGSRLASAGRKLLQREHGFADFVRRLEGVHSALTAATSVGSSASSWVAESSSAARSAGRSASSM